MLAFSIFSLVKISAVSSDSLAFILKARAIGLTLEEIGDTLRLRDQGQQPCAHVLALLDRKVATIDQQMRALRDVRRDLLDLRQYAVHNLPADVPPAASSSTAIGRPLLPVGVDR